MLHISSTNRKVIIIGVVALLCFGLVATIGTLGHQSSTSTTFRACFGTLLCLLGCIQLHVSVALFKNRQTTLLELSQPLGLSLFALSGAIATFGSFTLALPEYDAACAIRQPIILTCISFMGSITVARVWRISCLMSPAISRASSSWDKVQVDKVQLARTKLLNVLSKISGCALVVGSCGRYRSDDGGRLHKQITLADSMRVVAVLMMPQVLLQVINLSVSTIRMQSVEVYDGIYACESSTGPLFLILGIVLAVAPFFTALLLNVKSEGMHDVFREFDQLLACGKTCIGVLVITLPTVGMIAHIIPNAHAYLLAASLLSFILPFCYQIAWLRLHATRIGKAKRTGDVLKRSTSLASHSSVSTKSDKLETLQIAEDAAAARNMFVTMGNMAKAIEVSNDILTMFKKEGDYMCDVGFTNDEVNSFGPKTLKMVVSSLISYSQHWLNQCHDPNLSREEKREVVQKACNCGMDALKIFERSPAKGSLDNKSFVFRGYSMMSLSINCGAMDGAMDGANLPGNQSLADVESDCATNFAKESQFQVFHYCRALAIKAGALAKVQKFDDAFSVLEEMKAIYDPGLHTKAIMDAYGTDHCATMVAVSALWHQHLNQKEKALRVCDDVIELILPAVAETNTNNSNLLGINYVLFPIIRVMASQDREGVDRAYEIYNSHVMKPFEAGVKRTGPGPWFIFPIKIILTCCSIATDRYNVPVKYDGLEEDVKWMLNGETKVVDEFDTDVTNRFGLSIYSLLAEACLQLAKRVEISSDTRGELIEEGLRYSALADPKMKDKDGNVTNHIAYNFNTHIYSQFRTDKRTSESSSFFRGTVGSITNKIVEGQQEPMSVHTSLQDCVLHDVNDGQLDESCYSARSSIGSIIDIVEGQQDFGIEDIPA